MAYVAGNLSLISSVNGFGLYRYDSTDAAGVVDGDGYFNNADDNLNLAVGDLIWVYEWTTVRTGDLVAVSLHAVAFVTAAGVVNLSDDLLSATLTSGD